MLNRAVNTDGALMRTLMFIQRYGVLSGTLRNFMDHEPVSICQFVRGVFATIFQNSCIVVVMSILLYAATIFLAGVGIVGSVVTGLWIGSEQSFAMSHKLMLLLTFTDGGEFYWLSLLNSSLGAAIVALIIIVIVASYRGIKRLINNGDQEAYIRRRNKKQGITVAQVLSPDLINTQDFINAARGKLCFNMHLPLVPSIWSRHKNYSSYDGWRDGTVQYFDQHGRRHSVVNTKRDDPIDGTLLGWAYLPECGSCLPVISLEE